MGLKGQVIGVFRETFGSTDGLYNYGARSYKISVDGELMRFSGCFESNYYSDDPETAIATTAFETTKRVIDRVIELMGARQPYGVDIYMDGKRVENKEVRAVRTYYNHTKVRKVYCNLIQSYSDWTLKELVHGESELHMYLDRDRNAELNIFVTRDSDMLPILYAHSPILKCVSDRSVQEDASPSLLAVWAAGTSAAAASTVAAAQYELPVRLVGRLHEFYGRNCRYADNSIVLDSCAWFNNSHTQQSIYGMDNAMHRIGFSPLAFHTLCALSGTDFTQHGLTKTAVRAILNLSPCDKQLVNALTTPFEMYVAFLAFAVRCHAAMLRSCPYQARVSTLKDAELEATINEIFNVYHHYIMTAEMQTMPKVFMSAVNEKLLNCIMGAYRREPIKRQRIFLDSRPIQQIIHGVRTSLLRVEPPPPPQQQQQQQRQHLTTDTVAVATAATHDLGAGLDSDNLMSSKRIRLTPTILAARRRNNILACATDDDCTTSTIASASTSLEAAGGAATVNNLIAPLRLQALHRRAAIADSGGVAKSVVNRQRKPIPATGWLSTPRRRITTTSSTNVEVERHTSMIARADDDDGDGDGDDDDADDGDGDGDDHGGGDGDGDDGDCIHKFAAKLQRNLETKNQSKRGGHKLGALNCKDEAVRISTTTTTAAARISTTSNGDARSSDAANVQSGDAANGFNVTVDKAKRKSVSSQSVAIIIRGRK